MKTRTWAAVCGIEPLEARIAPAAFVTYPDVDGDLVRITASKGPLDAGELSFIGGPGGSLAKLTLTDPGFEGATIAFTVTKKPGGDGQVQVAVIDATGVNLKSVTIKGDLGEISAGNGAEKFGLGLLSVRALGILGFNDDGDVVYSNAHSLVSGGLGALKLSGNFNGAKLEVSGTLGPVTIGGSFLAGPITVNGIEYDARLSASGAIGNVTIRGDLQGGAGDRNGVIESGGAMGNVKIGRDFLGGAGTQGGYIHAASIGNVTVGRDFLGGDGTFSASITAGKMGNITIGGDLRAGDNRSTGYLSGDGGMGNVKIAGSVIGGRFTQSGTVQSNGAMGSVTIGGDLAGGDGFRSGAIVATGALGNVKIGGDLTGGAGTQSGFIYGATIGKVSVAGDVRGGSATGMNSVADSGAIFSEGRIASVTIGKSLIAGTDTSTGALTRSGAIVAGSLGPVKIGIGIVGNSTNPALIVAEGLAVKPATGFDLAIASLTVKGDVRFAAIRAGFGSDGAPANADAAIGAVSVGANWVSSSLEAGVVAGTFFGPPETLQTVNNTGLVARIASISIKGELQAPPGTHYAFLAEHIAKMSIGGKTIALKAGPKNDFMAFGNAAEFYLREPTS